VHLVGFIIKKFDTMHGHTKRKTYLLSLLWYDVNGRIILKCIRYSVG